MSGFPGKAVYTNAVDDGDGDSLISSQINKTAPRSVSQSTVTVRQAGPGCAARFTEEEAEALEVRSLPRPHGGREAERDQCPVSGLRGGLCVSPRPGHLQGVGLLLSPHVVSWAHAVWEGSSHHSGFGESLAHHNRDH